MGRPLFFWPITAALPQVSAYSIAGGMTQAETLGTQGRPFAAASLIAVIFINMLGFGIIIPLLPFYAQSFQASPWQIGAIFGAYSIGAFFGEPLWGRLSDRYGRKPLLISTIMGNCLCYLALAFTTDIWAAFFIRFLGGLAAGNGAVIMGYVADVTPPNRRARVMAYEGAAWNVGLILGPAAGGFFVGSQAGPEGFRMPLFIASGLALLCVIATMVFIRESQVREPGQSYVAPNWSTVVQTLRHPIIGRLILLTFVVGFAFTGIESTLGLWAQSRFGWGPKDIAICFSCVGVAAFVTQTFLTAPLSERFGETRMLALGMALTVVAAALQPLSTGTVITIGLMCLIAVGQSVAYPYVRALISRAADPHRQGHTLGLNNASGALARVVGPVCAGLVFAVHINAPFLMGALIVAPAMFLALSISRHAQRDLAGP